LLNSDGFRIIIESYVPTPAYEETWGHIALPGATISNRIRILDGEGKYLTMDEPELVISITDAFSVQIIESKKINIC